MLRKESREILLSIILLYFFICVELVYPYLKQTLIECICHIRDRSSTTSSKFSVQFFSYIRNTLSNLQKNMNNTSSHQGRNAVNTNPTKYEDIPNDQLLNIIDDMALDPSTLVVKINAMCIIYHHLFGNLDQKLFSAIIEVNTKVRIICKLYPCCNLYHRFQSYFEKD